MFRDSMWIGVPRTELKKWNILEGDLTGCFAYYKCELELMVAGTVCDADGNGMATVVCKSK